MDKIFDPHLHFFALQKGNYNWLKGNNGPNWPNIATIKRDFGPKDLVLEDYELVGYCHIEAGFDNENPERELEYLTSLGCSRLNAISHIPVDLAPFEFARKLSQLSGFHNCVGIRDITEGEEVGRLFNQNVQVNLEKLAEQLPLFEAQFELYNEDATSQLVQLALAVPKLNIVINHAGLVTQAQFGRWQCALEQLANCDNIFVKFSGFEMLPESSFEFEKKVLASLLTHFGKHRVMFASNFPLCLMAIPYQTRWDRFKALCGTSELWQQLSYHNAAKLYITANKR